MINKSQCCGCTACRQICPMQCIAMCPDEEGFLYPKIDENRCIHCGKCEKVCPIGYPLTPEGATQTYVGYAKDLDTRRASSSGGVFSLAAQWVLARNGVVFGAAFDEQFRVHHVSIEKEEELCKLRGSKYVQSDLENTYVEAEGHLKSGRWVLFSGTACQIAGLRKYLGKAYDRLLSIDVLCHGAPSPKIWQMYLQDQEKKNNSKITSIYFRDKELGWKLFSMKIQFENGRVYSRPFTKDSFMNMFLSNIDLRDSCYDCRFMGIPRVSDLTIGDCWGVENQMPEMDDDQGTSVILVHTDKGQRLWQEIQKAMSIKEAQMDKILPIWSGGRSPAAKHPNRKKFWKAVQKGEQLERLNGYVRKTFFQRAVSFMNDTLKKITQR